MEILLQSGNKLVIFLDMSSASGILIFDIISKAITEHILLAQSYIYLCIRGNVICQINSHEFEIVL